MSSACKYCAQPVQWGVTEKGRRMPLNPGHDDQGNVAVVAADRTDPVNCRVISRAHPLKDGEELRTPHFATCTNYPRQHSAGKR